MTDFEKSVSGFLVEGKWTEIVEHGEQIAYALEQIDLDDEMEKEVKEYNEWRPKSSEALSEDVNKKTAEQASLDESKTESPKENIKDAGEDIAESYSNYKNPRKMVSLWGDSAKHTVKSFEMAIKTALRNAEIAVYKNIMTRISPYYFDNQLVSANITKKSEYIYIFEVNINGDDLKEQVHSKLKDYDDEYKRWHLSTKFDAESARNAEGEGEISGAEDQDNEDNPSPTST
jgi:hypothetical protein